MKLATGEIRKIFPALEKKINNRNLVYFDTAATALKPIMMIEALTQFYKFEASNIHRAAHYLSARATENYELAREKTRQFINAYSTDEIIFTKGTTESINLVAACLGESFFKAGDEIIITEMEHHSNIVPWQEIARKKDLKILWAPVTKSGELDLKELAILFSPKTKLIALTHCSNTLGTVNDIGRIIKLAHDNGVQVLIDAAQSVTFEKIDVQKLNCDYLVFSAHKLYGPFGLGILYMRRELAESLPPYQFGGAMIADVSKDNSTYLASPNRFEAGTPNISAVIGFSAALDFFNSIGATEIRNYEQKLIALLDQQLRDIPNVEIVGTSASKINLSSFVVKGLHTSDIGTLLDQQGVALRTGHHCTLPLLKKLNLHGTVRVSLGVYNTPEEIEYFVKALKHAMEILL